MLEKTFIQILHKITCHIHLGLSGRDTSNRNRYGLSIRSR